MGKDRTLEIIKTEIERLKAVQFKRIQEGDLVDAEPYDKNEAYNELLSFLDTLESEKPMEGLEEEIDRIVKCEKEFMNFQCRSQLIAYIARHFAKWGAEHFRDTTKNIEPPCHTVEEWIEHIKNADQLTKDIFSMGPYDVLYDALNRPYRDCYDAIKEFGELCYQTARQEMMKEAVVYVAEPETPIGNILMPFIRIEHSILFRYGIKVGDKVRIIIVKEDEK